MTKTRKFNIEIKGIYTVTTYDMEEYRDSTDEEMIKEEVKYIKEYLISNFNIQKKGIEVVIVPFIKKKKQEKK